MYKQVLVIGLGQFGSSLARSLARHGADVLAVDIHAGHVAEVAPYVSDAVELDAMDEAALSSLAPEGRDICVCAIGDEHREGSIIVTALLKQLGAKRIIARATDDLHARILGLVGAHEVINPERSYGERLAVRIAWRNVLNVLHLGGDLVLTEIMAPEPFWGRRIGELEVMRRYHANVAAMMRRSETGFEATVAQPDQIVREGDILMLVSTEDAARRLTERL